MGREQGHLTPRLVFFHHNWWVPWHPEEWQEEGKACSRRYTE